MPTAREIERALAELAPLELAQKWDNVGLLVGRPDREVRKVLVSLDITEAVAGEADRLGVDLIVAHHPLMNCHWSPVQTILDNNPQGRILMQMIKCYLSAICMHTNLDAAQGGVNDALADALGLEQIELLEEGDGIVRTGMLPSAVTLPVFLQKVHTSLHPNGIRYVDSGKLIRRVAVGGGACGGYFRAAVAQGCDAFVTADVKYDQFLDAKAFGLSLIDAGHFPTEDIVCPLLVKHLQKRFPELDVQKSSVHQEIISYFVTTD